MLLNALIKPLWLLMEMRVQDKVGHSDWGLYSALLSLGFLCIALTDMGLTPYATRQLALRPDEFRQRFPGLLGVKLLLVAAYPFILLPIGALLGYGHRELGLLFVLCLVHSASQMGVFFRSYFQATQQFNADSWLSVLDRALLLVLTAVLLVLGLNIWDFAWARLATLSAGAGLIYFLLARRHGLILPRFQKKEAEQLLRAGFSFALMTILYSLHDKVDQVMLERMAGQRENGLYAGAYRWLDAISMYLWTILPIFFARFAFFQNDTAAQERLLRFGQRVAAIPMLLVSLWVMFYPENLLFIYTNSSPEEVQVMAGCLRALFCAAVLNGIFAIFSTLLTATGHERPVNRFVLLSIGVNVLLNLLLIPRYGAEGSAWATVASYGLMDLAYVWYISRQKGVALPSGQILRLLLLAGLLSGCFGLMVYAGVQGWIAAGAGALVCVAGAWLLGLLKREPDVSSPG